MTMQDLCGTIDLLNRDFSLVLVTPNERLLEWLKEYWKLNGLEQYRNYIEEENTVLVIPNIDRFSEIGSLDQFLEKIKPHVFYSELERFHVVPEDFGMPITKDTFDEWFDVALRDSSSIHFLSDFSNL